MWSGSWPNLVKIVRWEVAEKSSRFDDENNSGCAGLVRVAPSHLAYRAQNFLNVVAQVRMV